MNIWLLSVLSSLVFAQYEASNILLLTPMGSKSHKNFFMGIVKALSERGHIVTIVSTHKNQKSLKNVKDVVLPVESTQPLVRNVFDNFGSPIFKIIRKTPELCTNGLLTKEIEDLKKEKFDLILVSLFFSECYFSLVHHFKVPFAWMSPAGLLFGVFDSNSGNLPLTSIVPNKMTGATYPLTFTDRLISTVLGVLLLGSYSFHTLPEVERICREKGACPPDMPPIPTFFPNASITLLNSIQTLDVPQRPVAPNTFHVGGIHCVPAQPLPKDLEEWFQGSGDDGVIFFSLGSALTPSYMPEKFRKIFVKVFSSLKQRVIWQWDMDFMDDLPSNVKISKWLPQQDILGHPKIRLFLSHGGLLSTTEAAYHGCPIIGLPLYVDQFSNIEEGVKGEWALSVHWNELTEELLYSKIQQALKDRRMKRNIVKRSQLMNDVDMSPKDKATYWIEYVIRHNGAPHMKSPITGMNSFTFYNMDVWATITSLMFITLYVVYILLCCARRCIFYRSNFKNLSHQVKKKEA